MADMQNWNQLHLGIDKVALSIPQDGNPDVIPAHELQCVLNNTPKWVQQYHHKKKAGHTGISAVYKNDAGSPILTVTSGCIWGKRFAQYSFNPSKLHSNDWQYIENVLQNQFENGIYTLFEVGRVKRLEVFVDILNVKNDTVRTISSRCHSYDVFVGQETDSEYSGKITSAQSVIVYDKRQQMIAKDHIDIGYERTRIEARLHLPQMTMYDLATKGIKDPWASTFVVTPEALQQLCGKPNMPKAFYKEICSKGLYAAMKDANVNSIARKSFVSELGKLCHPLWHQDKFWSVHFEMVRLCLPN